jgi:hypothetical protein
MPVPFDKLGPGQSGRLAYQVMGKDGPVFNPAGIRYLEPSDATAGIAASTAALDVLPALAGINLAVSVGTLALSAATHP